MTLGCSLVTLGILAPPSEGEGVIAMLQMRKRRLRLNHLLVVPWPVNTKKIRTQAFPLGLTGRF